MVILYRAVFVLLLSKLGSGTGKPQWAARCIPSLKVFFHLILMLRYFPKYPLGGPTTNSSHHIKGQPGEELACQIRRLPLSIGPESGTWFTLLSQSWRQRTSTSHGLLTVCTKLSDLVIPSTLRCFFISHRLAGLALHTQWKEGKTLQEVSTFSAWQRLLLFLCENKTEWSPLLRSLATCTFGCRLI